MIARLSSAVRESLGALGAVYANPRLRLLQVANTSAILGGWSYVVALAVLAYREDGAYAVGLLAMVRWVVAGVAAPVAGFVGDRFPRIAVMVASDLVRAGLLGGMALAVVLDASPFLVYALAVAAALSAAPFGPAQAALLPQLARTPGELTAANVSTSTVDNVGSFLGPALGGALLAASSVEVVFGTAAVLYGVSALFVAAIRHEEEPAGEDGAKGSLLAEAAAGFSVIATEPRLRLIVVLLIAQTLVDGALDVLLVVLALETLDIGASGLGFLNSAAGAGGIAAALVVGGLLARGRLATNLGTGIALWGAPILLIGIWPEQAVAIVLLALIGAGGTSVTVTSDTLLQRAVPQAVLARAFGALDGVLLVSLALGSVSAPLLVDAIGDRAAFVATGALLPVLALISWRSLAAIDAAALVPVRELELLRGSPIFAPLPPSTLEALAARLEPRQVAAGDEVVRQGEPGDAFFLVDAGTARVLVDGIAVDDLREGESFGEIALLRDVPRTATVVAETDLKLLALDRDEFVAAVTGHTESSAAADALVGVRLGRHSPASL